MIDSRPPVKFDSQAGLNINLMTVTRSVSNTQLNSLAFIGFSDKIISLARNNSGIDFWVLDFFHDNSSLWPAKV
jgi:hypothetical protein